LSVTAFYSAQLFKKKSRLSCQTWVVWLKSELWKMSSRRKVDWAWLKSELWKRAATPLLCFHTHRHCRPTRHDRGISLLSVITLVTCF
jgi:hypothetical protein